MAGFENGTKSLVPYGGAQCISFSHTYFQMTQNIRILHGYEVWIENYIPRVTIWHHKALPNDAKR